MRLRKTHMAALMGIVALAAAACGGSSSSSSSSTSAAASGGSAAASSGAATGATFRGRAVRATWSSGPTTRRISRRPSSHCV